jgi:hypothetical protein
MAALGNPEAVTLLKDELERWQYSANLMACHDFTDSLTEEFWSESLANLWLDSLRTLDQDMSEKVHAPAVLKTRAWQRKQLQTQLGSWAELRHDTILYAKQSYGVPGCAYPTGYVEPYPEFYRRLRQLAEVALSALSGVDCSVADPQREQRLRAIKEKQAGYFQEMIGTCAMLETIAQRELRAEALTPEEKAFLQATFDNQGTIKFGSSRQPIYDGWYCRLFYERHQSPGGWKPLTWKPVIADVHTDPNSKAALEVGTGNVNLLVIGVDSEDDRCVYVGPAYSYYEFWQPAEERLTDEVWKQRLRQGDEPARPTWTEAFRVDATARPAPSEFVNAIRQGNMFRLVIQRHSGRSTSYLLALDRKAFNWIADHPDIHGLDLSDSWVGNHELKRLAGMTDLRSLSLRGTKITDRGLAAVSQHRHLQSLDLSSTRVTDACLGNLAQLRSLEILNLLDTQISPEGLDRLKTELPRAKILRF